MKHREPQFNNVLEQMQYDAEQIVPGVNLARLLRRGARQRRSPEDRRKIAKLMRSGNVHLEIDFLACCFGVNRRTLRSILYSFNPDQV